MDHKVFKELSKIVYDRAGINLGEGKESLVSARIGKRLRALGITTEKEYLQFLKNDTADTEIVELLDVISTNVTSFFRESEHFDFLNHVMVEWINAGQKRFRIWCAASSTGEEPYSIAMTLSDLPKSASLDMRILATDISTRVLRHCKEGVYRSDRMDGVGPKRMSKWFEPLTDAHGAPFFQVDDRLRQMIHFRRLNLIEHPFPMSGPLDVVFCRNVMIYFDNSVRKRLLDEINRLLRPGGFLFVGHAESLTGMISGFKSVRPSVYIKQ